MHPNLDIDPVLEYTGPENRGVCGFCGKEENGYAKRDANGKWQAACWPCVKPQGARLPQEKRVQVDTTYTDVDADELEVKKKKNPGMAPCKSRPKVV